MKIGEEYMDIERIDENTVKFYITYGDIESRGFERNEIWDNRERGEELFWEMMEEANTGSDFVIDGPLWIQVHAMESGLEIVVTKANAAKEGKEVFPMERFEQLFGGLRESIKKESKETTDVEQEDQLQFMFCFHDFEDVISLGKKHDFSSLTNHLFIFENKYYLFVEFHEEDKDVENVIALISEFGYDSPITIYRLNEYGKEIISNNALTKIVEYFPN